MKRKGQLRKAPVLALVERKPDERLVAILQELLSKALSGDLLGLTYVASYGRGDYGISVLGDLRVHPTYARGAVRAIDDYLRTLLSAEAAGGEK